MLEKIKELTETLISDEKEFRDFMVKAIRHMLEKMEVKEKFL